VQSKVLQFGVEQRCGRKKWWLSTNKSLYLRHVRVEPRLLLITDKMLQKLFQMTRKSSTLDDLEGLLCTLLCQSCVLQSWPRIYMYERRHTYTICSKNVAL